MNQYGDFGDELMEQRHKVSIVILTYNNLQFNKDCIESICKYTNNVDYEIIVVDNNSTDGTKEWLGEQKNIKLLLNNFNAGFPKGCNMGIALASKDNDILLLNNDTIVTPNWLVNLETCLYSDKKIGAVGAVSNHNENLQGADFSYTTLEEMYPLAQKNNISDSSRWEEKVFLIGYCLLIKREVLNLIGDLDEKYSPGYVEDNDLSIRILTAGYKLMLCHDCMIHHYLGTEFRKNVDRFYPVLNANRRTFQSKWGFETYQFDQIDYAALRLIDVDRNKSINILQIGCGIGVTLLKVKGNYKNASLYGLEPDKSMAAIAKHICQVSTKPVNEFPFEFPEEFFDYILLGDQLSNLERPEYYLSEIKKHLKPDGFVIANFQNPMHYSVLRNLLRGTWFYAKDDMLGRTHKNLFTISDFINLFASVGYRNPYIFHWFSVPNEEEKQFVRKLCEIGEEKRDYIYHTYLFTTKFQK